MKQYITVEQLKELRSDDKICKLNTLMNHEWNLTEEEFKNYCWTKILEDTAEYCTIGRMIEVLHKDNDHIGMHVYRNRIFSTVSVEPRRMLSNDELCDALWEAVKRIL